MGLVLRCFCLISTWRGDTRAPLATHPRAAPETVAALTTVRGGQADLHEGAPRLRPAVTRRPSWRRALASGEALLRPTQRKNAWHLAAVGAAAPPDGGQHLLGRAVWPAAHLRAALYASVGAPSQPLRAGRIG